MLCLLRCASRKLLAFSFRKCTCLAHCSVIQGLAVQAHLGTNIYCLHYNQACGLLSRQVTDPREVAKLQDQESDDAMFTLVNLPSLGPKLQSQNCVDAKYENTFSLRAQLTKKLWKSNISLTLSQKEKSLAPKLTDWQPYKLKWALLMGLACTIFEPHLSNF